MDICQLSCSLVSFVRGYADAVQYATLLLSYYYHASIVSTRGIFFFLSLLSDATRTKGIGGHGAENETSKVVVYMAILTIFNLPQLISRFGLGSE